jgi:hypothetical protein
MLLVVIQAIRVREAQALDFGFVFVEQADRFQNRRAFLRIEILDLEKLPSGMDLIWCTR